MSAAPHCPGAAPASQPRGSTEASQRDRSTSLRRPCGSTAVPEPAEGRIPRKYGDQPQTTRRLAEWAPPDPQAGDNLADQNYSDRMADPTPDARPGVRHSIRPPRTRGSTRSGQGDIWYSGTPARAGIDHPTERAGALSDHLLGLLVRAATPCVRGPTAAGHARAAAAGRYPARAGMYPTPETSEATERLPRARGDVEEVALTALPLPRTHAGIKPRVSRASSLIGRNRAHPARRGSTTR